MSHTIAAIATGAQVAAIGVIRLSGDESIRIAESLFHPMNGNKLSQHEDRRLVYGLLKTREGQVLDSCLCTISHAPHSYTGEDTAELQCHGSPVLLRQALEEMFALGARQAGPGEFTRRAFLNGKLDLTQAEAVADIIDAETAEQVRNAAGQLSGAVSRKMEGIYSTLTDISAHYHAVLDYPDEDIEDFRLKDYQRSMGDMEGELRGLLSTFSRGKLMSSGIPCAIVGCPNAGKSSLLNALLGYDRAIVTDIPGTTRDTIEEKAVLGGVCLRLIDTAGIRAAGDEAERLGVERSRRAAESAMLVLAVVDGSRAATPEDREIIAMAERAERALLILSKEDIEGEEHAPYTRLPVIRLSSVTGKGLDELEREIGRLFPLPQVPAGEILTNARQAQAVAQAAEYMAEARHAMELGATPDIVLTETEGAMAALGELTGRTVREDVTSRIFSRFCVGK